MRNDANEIGFGESDEIQHVSSVVR
jgi:hypothetical protein